MNGRLEHAHRVAWEAVNGPVPEGSELHHLCGVKGCVNPEHLEAVTRSEHFRIHRHGTGLLPLIAAKRAQTHCIHGHAFTPENTTRRENGTRSCRRCRADRARARRALLAEGTART